MPMIRVNKDMKKLLNEARKNMGCKSMSQLILLLLAGRNYITSMGLKFERKWIPYVHILSLTDIPEGSIETMRNQDVIFAPIRYETEEKTLVPNRWLRAMMMKAIESIEKEAKKYNWSTQPIYVLKDKKRKIIMFYALYPKDTKIHIINKNLKGEYRKDDPRF